MRSTSKHCWNWGSGTTVWAWVLTIGRDTGWLCATVIKDTKFLKISFSARRVVTSSRSLWFSCSRWSILTYSSVVNASRLMDRPFIEKTRCETQTRNYEWKMMHDMFMKKWIIYFFFEGLIRVNCKHRKETWFHFKIVKILQFVPFSKGKNETRDKSS